MRIPKPLVSLVLALAVLAGQLAAQDKYVGYYYPEITSTEVFDRVIRDAGASNKRVRVDFLTTLTTAQLAAPESPRFVFFAKGEASDQLILVALDDDVFKTLYRARAIMAQMTSNMRDSPFFVNQNLQFVATFYDLLQMLEFNSLVITDGDTWAHQVAFQRN